MNITLILSHFLLVNMSPLSLGVFVGSGLTIAGLVHLWYAETHPEQRPTLGLFTVKGTILWFTLLAVALVVTGAVMFPIFHN